ncbi:MAG TPA: hypothetical protein VHO72_03635 [Bacteroidales bacterium]|nr:hypothetical protein [Bacteroidales bacterium]
MKQTQFNFHRMSENVVAGLDKEKAIWENEPEIVALVEEIRSYNSLIVAKGTNISGTVTTSYTAPKNDSFDKAMSATYKLCRKMSAYAKINNDGKLLPLVDLSLTGLSRGIEKEALLRCQSIAQQAEALLPALEKYKVTADEIAFIRQMIAECTEYSNQRSVANSGKVNDGKDIGTIISDLRKSFDTLDDLIEGLIDDQAFINRYKSLRFITDYGKGKTQKNKNNDVGNKKEVA